MSPQYGELRLTSGWDWLTSLGYPCKFQLVSRLGSVRPTGRHLVVGVTQTLRRWTGGAIYIRQGDHHVGHWPTFLVSDEIFHHRLNPPRKWQYCNTETTRKTQKQSLYETKPRTSYIRPTWCFETISSLKLFGYNGEADQHHFDHKFHHSAGTLWTEFAPTLRKKIYFVNRQAMQLRDVHKCRWLQFVFAWLHCRSVYHFSKYQLKAIAPGARGHISRDGESVYRPRRSVNALRLGR